MAGYIDTSADEALWGSYNGGRVNSGKQSTKVSNLAQWSALLDSKTCDFCSWADERIFDTSAEPYDPPMHFGCRCLIALILNSEFPPQPTWGKGPPSNSFPPGRIGKLGAAATDEGKVVLRTVRIGNETTDEGVRFRFSQMFPDEAKAGKIRKITHVNKSRIASNNSWEVEFETAHTAAKPARVTTKPKAKTPTKKVSSEGIKGSKVEPTGDISITGDNWKIRLQMPDSDGLRPHEVRAFNRIDDKLLKAAGSTENNQLPLRIVIKNSDDLGTGRTGGFKAQASANADTGTINLARGGLSEDQLVHVLNHELGHIIDPKVGAKLVDLTRTGAQASKAATLTDDVRTSVKWMMDNWDDLTYELRTAYSYPRTMWIQSNNNLHWTAQEAWAESVSYWYTKPDLIKILPRGLKDVLTTAMEGL